MKPWDEEKRGRRILDPNAPWAEALAAKIIADCHPDQRSAVLDSGRRVSLLVGRGGGKTTTERARLVIKAVRIPKARLVYVALTRVQATDLMWYPLKDLLERLGIEATFNETQLRCTINRTGSTIRLVGADDRHEIDKLRGQSFHEVAIDEAGTFGKKLLDALIFRVIAPRLGNYDGCIILGGTPGHLLEGEFYDATRTGGDKHRPFKDRELAEWAGWKGWSSHYWTLETAAKQVPAMARLWAEALIEKENNQWADDNPIWLREYLGLWAADNSENIFKYRAHTADGKPWNQWDPERIGPYKFARLPDGPTDWIFGYGMDLGSKDPFALNVFALSPSDPTRTIRHVFGFEKRQMYARTIAEMLVGESAVAQVLRGDGLPDVVGGLFGITGWPVAIVADLAGLGGTLIDELAQVYGIRIKAAEKKGKFGAFEVFNGDLLDGRMLILKGSNLEEQLATLQWQPDEYGQLKENKGQSNHSTDSAIYVRTEIGHLFDARAESPKADRPTFAPTPDDDDPDNPSERGEYGGLLSDRDFGSYFG